jgi:ABC-type sugar transport system substrate-binding protein
MTTVHLQVAPRVGPSMPRGSRYAAAAFMALWRAVAAMGRSAPPRAKTPTQEAQEARELAWIYRQSDPGFAADLAAAADRHERLHGVD